MRVFVAADRRIPKILNPSKPVATKPGTPGRILGAVRLGKTFGRRQMFQRPLSVASALLATVACVTAQSFTEQSEPVGDHPVFADFDRDGNSDLLSGNTVRLGDGTGAFPVTSHTFPAGPGADPGEIEPDTPENAIGDFDDDGIIDVVRVHYRELTAFLGNGDGTFTQSETRTNFPAPLFAFFNHWITDATVRDIAEPVDGDLVVCDFDGDSRLDIVVEGTSSEHVLLGDGTGHFGAPTAIGQTGKIAVADLDVDGDVDIAVTSGHVFLNQRAHPAGVSTFGTGTPGCGGVFGATTTGTAFPGNSDFAFVATNAPRDVNIGVCYIATAGSPNGIYVAPLDFTYHVDVFTTAFLVTIPVLPDATNAVFAPLSIPPSAAPLVGATFYGQMKFWLGPNSPCQASLLDLATGPGIAFTVQ